MTSEATVSSDNLDLTPEARIQLGRVYSLLLRLAAEGDGSHSSPAADRAAEVSSDDEEVEDDPA